MSKSADLHLEQNAFNQAFAESFHNAVEDIDWSIVPQNNDNGAAKAALPELTLVNDTEYNPARPWERQIVKDLPAGPTDKPHKIEWITDSGRGYDMGVEQQKPIVMVFGENGTWSQAVHTELEKPEFQRLSNDAVFLKSTPSTDNVARNIGKALGIDAYPSISILSPNGDMIDEVGRIVGYFDAKTIADKVDEYINKINSRAAAPVAA